ncbi:MAG: hypothetical protein WBA42_02330 [Mesorhizobium sp.]
MADEKDWEKALELKEGYIEDFVSGVAVKATPEEIDAVQVFSRLLVEDYGYPKAHIRTRPQWRVKVVCPLKSGPP